MNKIIVQKYVDIYFENTEIITVDFTDEEEQKAFFYEVAGQMKKSGVMFFKSYAIDTAKVVYIVKR